MKKISTLRVMIVILFIIVIFLSIIFLNYSSNQRLEITPYTIINSKIDSSFRVVQLTDIHGCEFDANNARLIQKVKEANPNLILITGDIINYKEKNQEDLIQKAEILISQLVEIAPVYISYGNHEDAYDLSHNQPIADIYEKCGATVLRNEYTQVSVNGQSICLGGVYGYCPEVRYAKKNFEDDLNFMLDYEKNQEFKLLMCHIPLCWFGNSLDEWDVDVVMSGHVHGGQVRIPFIGGLWAPDQGWFPGRECGIYKNDEQSFNKHLEEVKEWTKKKEGAEYASYYANKKYSPSYMVLSRGLGNTDWMPRFNNVPEIVVVDFIPENEK